MQFLAEESYKWKKEKMNNIEKRLFFTMLLVIFLNFNLNGQIKLEDSISNIILNNYFAYNLLNNNKTNINDINKSKYKSDIYFVNRLFRNYNNDFSVTLKIDNKLCYPNYKFYIFYSLGGYSLSFKDSITNITSTIIVDGKFFKTPSRCDIGLVAYDTISKKISIISGDDVFIDYEFYEKNKLTDEEKARFFGYMFSYQGLPFEKNNDGYWCGRNIVIKNGKPYFDLKHGGRQWDER